MRWENRNTGKSGYAPACANEWVRGVCGKPQVKCGECPNQAFIALSDNVIASHLRGADPGRSSNGDFVAGVYPVLVDETSWFLGSILTETIGRPMRSLFRDVSFELGSRCARAIAIWQGWPRLDLLLATDSG